MYKKDSDTYDIYLLPPGEDVETCTSWLRMRNRDGRYNLMFEEWVTDGPFIISPRITFEVSAPGCRCRFLHMIGASVAFRVQCGWRAAGMCCDTWQVHLPTHSSGSTKQRRQFHQKAARVLCPHLQPLLVGG